MFMIYYSCLYTISDYYLRLSNILTDVVHVHIRISLQLTRRYIKYAAYQQRQCEQSYCRMRTDNNNEGNICVGK